MVSTRTKQDEDLRLEFNEWARAGRGERMERGHRPVGEQAIAALGISAGMRVLDVGCGSGWAARTIVQTADNVHAVGIDISDEMISVARGSSREFPNIEFYQASAEELPFEDAGFDAAFSMESLYYYANPQAALKEINRVLCEGGKIAVVVDMFRENEATAFWVKKLTVPVHFLGEREFIELFEASGFKAVEAFHLLDPAPITPGFDGNWFESAESYRRYREIGSLLITGRANHV